MTSVFGKCRYSLIVDHMHWVSREPGTRNAENKTMEPRTGCICLSAGSRRAGDGESRDEVGFRS